MSGYASQWARKQVVGDSATKAVLKTYAHWATEDYSTWVSNEELMLDTELNIQTIRRARTRLIELGYLIETGKRKGRTQSIVVYQMLTPPEAKLVQCIDRRRGETDSMCPPTLEEYLAKGGEKASPSKSRQAKALEISSHSKFGGARDSASSPSKFHSKQGEISSEAPPNFDTNIALYQHEKNMNKQPAQRNASAASHEKIRNLKLPPTISPETWAMWCEHREAKHEVAPWTAGAAKASINRLLALAAVSQPPEVTVEESVLRGWTGLFPLHAKAAASVPDVEEQALGANWWRSSKDINAKAKQLGIQIGDGELYQNFKARVFKAAGIGPWVHELLCTTKNESEERYQTLSRYFNDTEE